MAKKIIGFIKLQVPALPTWMLLYAPSLVPHVRWASRWKVCNHGKTVQTRKSYQIED